MVVIVMNPDLDRFAPLSLGVVGAGVKALIGHQPLVALDLPVVPWGVDPGALVAADERAGRTAERLGGVVAAVVGDQSRDPSDAVGGEEHACAVEEGDGRRSGLVLERLGVGQAGEPVDRGVEVGVADLLLVGALAGESLGTASTVSPPAATIRDFPDLLHVHVDHMARVAGRDLPCSAQVLAVRGDVTDPIQAEPVQPARHRPHTALGVVPVGEFTSNSSSGPLLAPSPVFDQLHHPHRQPGRPVRRCTGAVLKAGQAVRAVAGDPLRQRGPSDMKLRGDMRDRTINLEDLGDCALSSDSSQRGITVGHGTGLLPGDGCLDTTHRAGQGPVSSSPTR